MRTRRTAALVILMAVAFTLASGTTEAATRNWSATAGSTTWTEGANWEGGTAPANDLVTDIAQFDQASYTEHPNAGTVSVNGVVIGSSSATITLSGSTLTVGSGNISIASGNPTTISTVLGGSASLTKTGAGALTLSGANAYSGGFVLNGGEVNPTHNSAFGTGTVTLANGTMKGMFYTSANAVQFLAGAVVDIYGDGGGSRIVTFRGPVSFAGTAALSASHVSYANQYETVGLSGTVTLADGANIQFIHSANPSSLSDGYLNLGSISGGITLGSTTAGAGPGNRYTAAAITNTAYLGRGIVTVAGTLAGGAAHQVLELAGTGSFNVGPLYDGLNSPGLLFDGTGTYFPTNSTYAGGTFVNAGIVSVGGTMSSTPSTLNANVTNGPFGTGTLTLTGGELRANSGITLTVANAVEFTSGATFSMFTLGQFSTASFNGPTAFAGDATLYVSGATYVNKWLTVYLNGTVTLADGTSVTLASDTGKVCDGPLRLGSNAAGAGIALDSTVTTGTPVASYNVATITNTSAKTVTLSGTFTGGAPYQALTLAGAGAFAVTYPTFILGTSLAKSGSGGLTVSGDMGVRLRGSADLFASSSFVLITNAGSTIVDSSVWEDNVLVTKGGAPDTAITATLTGGINKGTIDNGHGSVSFASSDAGCVVVEGLRSGGDGNARLVIMEFDSPSDLDAIQATLEAVHPDWIKFFRKGSNKIGFALTPAIDGTGYFVWDNQDGDLGANVLSIWFGPPARGTVIQIR